MQETEMIEKVAHLEEREKSNTKRLNEHDDRLDKLEKTYSIMEKMDYRMGKVESAVEKIDQKLEGKVSEDDKEKGKKWDKLIDYIFYSILAVILGLIYVKIVGGKIMKQAWEDLKSFVTIAMIVLLFVIVIANLFGAVLSETILVLVTNLVTAVFTYYFSKNKTDVNTENKEE